MELLAKLPAGWRRATSALDVAPHQSPDMLKLLQDNWEGAVLDLRMSQVTPARAALALVFLLSALSGCADWVQVEGPYRMDSQGYEASLPAGWRRATTVSDSLLLTRDGVSLQYIRIERVPIGHELTHTKRKLAKGMLPQDVAALELDEVRSDQAVRNFALVENIPFQVTSLPGFKLVYTFKTENGLRLKRVHYGVLVRDGVYRVQYQAPARYYFEKDLATFERVRESFRLL